MNDAMYQEDIENVEQEKRRRFKRKDKCPRSMKRLWC
jgi:hypothetical protein